MTGSRFLEAPLVRQADSKLKNHYKNGELFTGPIVFVASELRYKWQVLYNATSGRTQAGLLYNHNGYFSKFLSKRY